MTIKTLKDIQKFYDNLGLFPTQYTQADEYGDAEVIVRNSEGKYVGSVSAMQGGGYQAEGILTSDIYATIEEAFTALKVHVDNSHRIISLMDNQKEAKYEGELY